VKLLLDTHAFLWAILDDQRLSDQARALMLTADNELLVSPVSYWEIAIKISLGKYTLNDDFETFMERQTVYSEFTPLPISLKHAAVVATLPFHHRDPFDRMLIAQAISEGIPIVSTDRALDSYSVTRIW
jgi:PIN domain nuclease of toxin-antitoxin system